MLIKINYIKNIEDLILIHINIGHHKYPANLKSSCKINKLFIIHFKKIKVFLIILNSKMESFKIILLHVVMEPLVKYFDLHFYSYFNTPKFYIYLQNNIIYNFYYNRRYLYFKI